MIWPGIGLSYHDFDRHRAAPGLGADWRPKHGRFVAPLLGIFQGPRSIRQSSPTRRIRLRSRPSSLLTATPRRRLPRVSRHRLPRTEGRRVGSEEGAAAGRSRVVGRGSRRRPGPLRIADRRPLSRTKGINLLAVTAGADRQGPRQQTASFVARETPDLEPVAASRARTADTPATSSTPGASGKALAGSQISAPGAVADVRRGTRQLISTSDA